MADQELELERKKPPPEDDSAWSPAAAPAAPAATASNTPSAPRPWRQPGAAWQVTATVEADAFWALGHALAPDPPTVFQTTDWLKAWYDTLGRQRGTTPLFITARPVNNPHHGEVLLLPLACCRRAGYVEIMSPDLGVSDYNAPLLGQGLSFETGTAKALWSGLRPVLARYGDVLHLDKMLAALPSGPNPFALALPTRASETGGHRFHIGQDWASWRGSLTRQVQREGERHARVFARWPGARFEHITDPDLALQVYRALELMQAARLRATGAYKLDQPAYSAVYERHLRQGLSKGSVVLTALWVGDEVVAALYALRQGMQCTVVRIAFGGEDWKSCAPGRLLMECSFKLLAQDGVSHFDLGVGDHAHKLNFGCERLPLLQALAPLTAKGHAVRLAWRGRAALRGAPGLTPRRGLAHGLG